MIKFMFVGRRAPGTTRLGALDHLRNVHAKMVVCPPPAAGAMPLDYVQNHVIDGAYPGSGAHALERDLVTELWFESLDHLRASTATPYYLDNLRPDEPRFVDDATVARMMVEPRSLKDGERGTAKAFLFIDRRDGDDGAWDATRDAIAAGFAVSPGLTAAVENRVLPPPGGEPPFVAVALEGWFARSEDAAAAVANFATTLAGGAGADPARSFAVFAEQFDTPRLQALHGCLPQR